MNSQVPSSKLNEAVTKDVTSLVAALERAEKALTHASQVLFERNQAEGVKALDAARDCMKVLIEFRG